MKTLINLFIFYRKWPFKKGIFTVYSNNPGRAEPARPFVLTVKDELNNGIILWFFRKSVNPVLCQQQLLQT
jgi:hypothetical protein